MPLLLVLIVFDQGSDLLQGKNVGILRHAVCRMLLMARLEGWATD